MDMKWHEVALEMEVLVSDARHWRLARFSDVVGGNNALAGYLSMYESFESVPDSSRSAIIIAY